MQRDNEAFQHRKTLMPLYLVSENKDKWCWEDDLERVFLLQRLWT